MSPHLSLPASLCDDLYTGLSQCQHTVELLESFTLTLDAPAAGIDGLAATLGLLKHRLYDLSLLVDPGLLAKSQYEGEVRHEQ